MTKSPTATIVPGRPGWRDCGSLGDGG
jgi:hypothetical protein